MTREGAEERAARRRLLRLIYRQMHVEIDKALRPFTRGGRLDLSSPHVVGTLPPEHGGSPPGGVPDPFVYLTDGDGEYLVDGDGNFLFEYL